MAPGQLLALARDSWVRARSQARLLVANLQQSLTNGEVRQRTEHCMCEKGDRGMLNESFYTESAVCAVQHSHERLMPLRA